MNARSMKKKLKQQISKLESDNKLMHKIISDSFMMQELYDLYNKPASVQHTTVDFQEFRAKRRIPTYMTEVDGFVEHIKRALAQDIFEAVKDEVTYEDNLECGLHTITASILVARKDG